MTYRSSVLKSWCNRYGVDLLHTVLAIVAAIAAWFFGKLGISAAAKPQPPWILTLGLIRRRMRAEAAVIEQRARRMQLENRLLVQKLRMPVRRKRKRKP